MFYTLSTIFFLTSQSFLILSANINIFPEVFFLSYLVNRGFIPFVNYFDDHGFLLQLILSPFVYDKSLLPLKIIYLIIHAASFYIFLLIIRKLTNSKFIFILAGVSYLLTAFFLNENDFWFETLILFFYLTIFYLTAFKNKINPLFIGLLITLTSFVKITSTIILIPVLFLTKKFRIAIIFTVTWAAVFLFYFYKGGLSNLFNNLFSYNFYLSRYYRPTYLSDYKFLAFGGGVVLFSLLFTALNKKLSKILPVFTYWLSCFIFLASGYSKIRLLPLSVFSLIVIFQSMILIKPLSRKILILLIIFYSFFMIFKVKNHRTYLNSQRIPYIENKTSLEITKTLAAGKYDNFYILSNNIQPYFLLNKLSVGYYPLKYPLINSFDKKYEDTIIQSLKNKNIQAVVIPKPIEEEFIDLKKIRNYLKQNYTLKFNYSSFQMLVK